MNIAAMSVTFDTFHFEISVLKDFASEKRLDILFILDTFHFPIGPRKPLEQSLSGFASRHALTAIRSSSADRAKKVLRAHTSDDIDPGESSNIIGLLAFE